MALNGIIYSSIAGAATLLGVSVVLWKQDLAIRYSHYVNAFAAGALLTIALAHLIPKSLELNSNSLLIVLISFLIFYILEIALVFHSGSAIHFSDRCSREAHDKGPVIFSGLFLHSLLDGFIITAGFETSLELGLFAAAGVILHELPEGVTSFALLVRSMSKKTAFILSLAVALATPVGAATGIVLLTGLKASGLGAMMAVAGGSFLYLAASDLIPETHEGNVLQNLLFVLMGVGLLYLLTILFG